MKVGTGPAQSEKGRKKNAPANNSFCKVEVYSIRVKKQTTPAFPESVYDLNRTLEILMSAVCQTFVNNATTPYQF